MNRALLASSLAVALLPSFSRAAQADPCTHRSLAIQGMPVTITLCTTGQRPGSSAAGKTLVVGLQEEFQGPKGSFSRTTSLEFLGGVAVSRTFDDVAIDRLGVARTLHMTLSLRGGSVTLEHAMLVPGAVPLI